jgi:hypothetical protein
MTTPNVTTRSQAVAARLSLFPITKIVPDTPISDTKNESLTKIIALLSTAADSAAELVEKVPTHEPGRLISGLDSMRQASLAFQEAVVLNTIPYVPRAPLRRRINVCPVPLPRINS